MTAPNCRRLHCGWLILAGLAALAASPVFGQTQWTPSRSTTRPGNDNVRAGGDIVPEWQRAPGQSRDSAVVRTSATTAFHEAPQPRTNLRTMTGGGAGHLAHDIQLAPGEQLVGQPRYSDGQPVREGQMAQSSQPVHQGRPVRQVSALKRSGGEALPTPDGVSNSPRPQPGTIIHEDAHDGAHYDGDVHFDPEFSYESGDMMHGDCSGCGGSGSCYSCSPDVWNDPPMCPDCGMYGYHMPGCDRAAMCLENCYGFIFRESLVFAGVQAFKGPADLGVNGNFGFNEGFNLVAPIVPFPRYGVGLQVGARFTQSNLSGNTFNSSGRDQAFTTAAIYHRAYRRWGLQWGLAYDWLDDNYYISARAAQVRYEFSFLFSCGHEIGMWGTSGVSNDEIRFRARTFNYSTIDQYNFFYRYTTDYGSEARLWAGLTADQLGILGADFRVPVSNRFDLIGGFNYIIPDDGDVNNGEAEESWNLNMNLVWYFGRRKHGVHNTPFRPLFNVADNGVMMFQPMF